jgi:hypothetical protein
MTGKALGILLILAGLGIGLILVVWLASGMLTGGLQITGVILGAALVFIFLVLPLVGVGAFLALQGQREAAAMAEVEKEKKILNMVSVQGKVTLSTVVLETRSTLEEVRNDIYDLVGKGLFTGYIDWKSSTLYAKDAGSMQSTKCPNCGGERELVGKGVVKCPYCGAELFIQ